MASAATRAATPGLRGDDSSAIDARLDNDDLTTAAWLCVVPCAVITILGILVLGPLVGDLRPGDPSAFAPLEETAASFNPEPTEQGRYLIALCGPLLYTAVVVSFRRWLPRVPAGVAAWGVPATQMLLVGALVVFVIAQYATVYEPRYARGALEETSEWYFTPATLVAAGLIAAVLVQVVRRPDLLGRVRSALRDTPARRLLAVVAAVALTLVWLLHVVHSDRSVGMAPRDLLYHTGFTLDEAFAVLNDRTPLVDFTTQYGSLWPYVAALAMLAFGKILLVYTIAMGALSGVALLAIYGVLCRVTRSALAALLLYVPFLATSLFLITGSLANRSSIGTFFSTFPTRYAGPYLLAWLTARQLSREQSGASLYLLFTVAGLVLLNNVEYGVAALGACLAALVWAGSGLRMPELRRLALALGGGLATAFALVCALTLARSESLPQLGRLVDYAGLFSVGGFGTVPIAEPLGMHLVLYVTFAAAIALATVRALRRAPDRLLTGMLAWSGVFGLGAASYFIGRSAPDTLKWLFSPWALTVALLTVAVVRASTTGSWRRPSIAGLAVLVGFGVTVCSIAQVPLPWQQVERLQAEFTPTGRVLHPNPLAPTSDPETRAFVASLANGRSEFVVEPGAPVAIVLTTGHRVADAYGVVNVSPYTGMHSMMTEERIEDVIGALREAGGNTIIMPNPVIVEMLDVLTRNGFLLVTDDGLRRWVPGETRSASRPWYDADSVAITKWVDGRNLHPRALEPAHR